MKKFRNYFSIALAAALAFASSGCMPFDPDRDSYQYGGVQAGVSASRVKIGVCIYTYEDAFMSSVRQALQSEAESRSIDLIMYDSKNDQETQNDQIDMLIDQGVAALVINIVDLSSTKAESTEKICDKAAAASIPLVFVHREPDLDVAQKYGNVRFVGADPMESSKIQGDLASKIWKSGNWDKNGDNVMQYVQITGEQDNPDARIRSQYTVETIGANGIMVERLAEGAANWVDDQAKTLMDRWEITVGLEKIEFILCNNDLMAKGAIESLNESGYNTGDDPTKYIPIVGVDALPFAIELINAGKMSGTVVRSTENMAAASLQLATNAVEGRDFLSGTGYTYDDSGIAIRLPYETYTGK